MSRIRKKSKAIAEISTASMPDIVFLLLFFFMVSAVIKTEDEELKIKVPAATQLTKSDQKILIKEMRIGVPIDAGLGTEPIISVSGRFIHLDQVAQWVEQEKASLPESLKDQMIVLIKADEMVKMGLIADIQQKLRKSNARKVLYRSSEKLTAQL